MYLKYGSCSGKIHDTARASDCLGMWDEEDGTCFLIFIFGRGKGFMVVSRGGRMGMEGDELEVGRNIDEWRCLLLSIYSLIGNWPSRI